MIDADQGAGAVAVAGGSETRRSQEVPMSRLMLVLFSIISTSLMGAAIVVALTMGLDTLRPILVAAAIGFVAAVPASWFVARRIEG
jgi:predicted PurR-regulated permease PerM